MVVGADQVFYGGDLNHIPEKSFREHVLKQDEYNLSKFLFTGTLPPGQLARLLSLSDLHIYFTVPFVLSWSLLDALACGCTVVASNTEPVREVIAHDQNGLLADFYDLDRLTNCRSRSFKTGKAIAAWEKQGQLWFVRSMPWSGPCPRPSSSIRA